MASGIVSIFSYLNFMMTAWICQTDQKSIAAAPHVYYVTCIQVIENVLKILNG